MKIWQKIVMIAVSVIAVLAITACGLLVWHQHTQSVAAMNALKAVEEEREAFRAEAEKKNTENDTLKQQQDALQKQLDELKKQQEETKKQQEQLQQENKSLKNQIALMAAKKTQNQNKTQPQNPTVQTGNKVCYLTFDDGPSEVTLSILATLKKYNVKATFFVTGAGKTAYLSNIHNEGHTLALHCNSHVYAQVYKSESAYFADLKAISDKVEKVTGTKPMVVRFPGGSSNTASRAYTKGLMTTLTKKLPAMGYAYFDWNVSSEDAGGARTAAAIRNNVLNGAKGKSSVCVLMHDAGDKRATAAALPGIIEGLKAQGFTFKVLTTDVQGFKHRVNN